MQVDLTAPADNFDADAFTRGVERMLEIIPRNDDVRLDVTTDLRASVRAKHPNREYAATYESDRDMATVMGKTIAQDDGTIDVVVDARVFDLGAPPELPSAPSNTRRFTSPSGSEGRRFTISAAARTTRRRPSGSRWKLPVRRARSSEWSERFGVSMPCPVQ